MHGWGKLRRILGNKRIKVSAQNITECHDSHSQDKHNPLAS
ncbi:hypothetical protein PLUTE_b0114 [Pseudoalteromonas luteoviolacea DSM 6061]|nr:hypothetical protein [Pseudoalteromonas luteoviolacea DSM 6061]